MTYSDHTDFNNFIINMCNKWSDARALRSKINDKDFKDIIITSLPESWNPIAAPLYNTNMTSADTIACLQIWYTKINKNRPTNIGQNAMALQTSTSKQKERS